MVYEISGPMFFAAAGKIMNISFKDDTRVLVIRMRSVNALDATALHQLELLHDDCERRGIEMVMSHVNEQPMKVMVKAGFDVRIGKDHFRKHVDDALKFAGRLAEKNNQ